MRGLSPELKARLRLRAAHNARSMEAEAKAILEAALSAPDDESIDLRAFARGLFAPLGNIDLKLLPRSPPRQSPQLGNSDEVRNEITDQPAAKTSPAPKPVADPPTPSSTINTRKRRR